MIKLIKIVDVDKDLRVVFEEVTGKDLSWFFDDVIKTTKQLDYAKQRTTNLGVLYIFSDGTLVNISNHLGDSVSWQDERIIGSEQNLIQGITLEVGGNEFAHEVPINAGKLMQIFAKNPRRRRFLLSWKTV